MSSISRSAHGGEYRELQSEAFRERDLGYERSKGERDAERSDHEPGEPAATGFQNDRAGENGGGHVFCRLVAEKISCNRPRFPRPC